MNPGRLAVMVLLLVSLAACGGDDEGGTPVTTGSGGTSTTEGPAATGTSTPGTTQAATTTVSAPEAAVPGTDIIELLTAEDGLGERPLLEWEAVDGAALYQVSVLEPDGDPYWSWQGEATSVPFGGGPADDPDTSGARLTTELSWFVAAFDADGVVLATSSVGRLYP